MQSGLSEVWVTDIRFDEFNNERIMQLANLLRKLSFDPIFPNFFDPTRTWKKSMHIFFLFWTFKKREKCETWFFKNFCWTSLTTGEWLRNGASALGRCSNEPNFTWTSIIIYGLVTIFTRQSVFGSSFYRSGSKTTGLLLHSSFATADYCMSTVIIAAG